MTPEDVEAKRGISYTASAEAAVAALDDGSHAAFLMRPTPVEQVRAVAAAGETMPPKSTYFYPEAAHRDRLQPAVLSAARRPPGSGPAAVA